MTSRPEDGGVTVPPICRRLLSVEQAAAHAGVAASRLRDWIKTAKLKTYRLHRGRIRVDEVELADLISSKRP